MPKTEWSWPSSHCHSGGACCSIIIFCKSIIIFCKSIIIFCKSIFSCWSSNFFLNFFRWGSILIWKVVSFCGVVFPSACAFLIVCVCVFFRYFYPWCSKEIRKIKDDERGSPVSLVRAWWWKAFCSQSVLVFVVIVFLLGDCTCLFISQDHDHPFSAAAKWLVPDEWFQAAWHQDLMRQLPWD